MQLRFELREHFCDPSLFAQDVSETYSIRTHSPVEFTHNATSLPQTRNCDLSSPSAFLLICLDGGKRDGKQPQNGNGVACVSLEALHDESNSMLWVNKCYAVEESVCECECERVCPSGNHEYVLLEQSSLGRSGVTKQL